MEIAAKERILAAPLELFFQNGFADTTIRELSGSTGMPAFG